MRLQPRPAYTAGEVVPVEFTGDDPRGPARPAYVVIEQEQDGQWQQVAGDGDWSVRLRFGRDDANGWSATVTWQVPAEAAGSYRVRYLDRVGMAHPTEVFTVR